MQTEAEMLDRVRDDEARLCAKDVCEGCREKYPVHQSQWVDRFFCHWPGDLYPHSICQASAIRKRRPAAFKIPVDSGKAEA